VDKGICSKEIRVMENKELNEMLYRLLHLTTEIYELDRKILDFEKEKDKFAPPCIQFERIKKTNEMYEMCKDYFFKIQG
jgi:hypothetical protein